MSGLLGALPGGLLAKRTVEIWTFVAEIAAKSALAERSGDPARRQAVRGERAECACNRCSRGRRCSYRGFNRLAVQVSLAQCVQVCFGCLFLY